MNKHDTSVVTREYVENQRDVTVNYNPVLRQFIRWSRDTSNFVLFPSAVGVRHHFTDYLAEYINRKRRQMVIWDGFTGWVRFTQLPDGHQLKEDL